MGGFPEELRIARSFLPLHPIKPIPTNIPASEFRWHKKLMQSSRSAWISSQELSFTVWRPDLQLQQPLASNFPQDLPPIVGFRVYSRLLPGLDPIGHVQDRPSLEELDEEEEADLARQEYFYSAEQLEEEVKNMIFATASDGTRQQISNNPERNPIGRKLFSFGLALLPSI